MRGVPAKPPRRARSERRQAEREAKKQIRGRERLAATAEGGAADRPVVVTSASVVEAKARSTPCPQCGGTLDLQRDGVAPGGDAHLRVMEMICRVCHAPRSLYFRVEAHLPS